MLKVSFAVAQKWMRSTEIVEFVLLYHYPDLLRLLFWSMCIGEPFFNRLREAFCRKLLHFQTTFGKKRQKRADRERIGMRGITQLLKTVLIGGAGRIFAHHQI